MTEQNGVGDGTEEMADDMRGTTAGETGQDGESGDFASRASEAAEAAKQGDDLGGNLAVTELLEKLAERTNELQGVQGELAERISDLQRLQAEYVNYRKRVERDRAAVREIALANVLTELLPVVDDIGRAREHGELEGGFRRVAEAFESILVKLGLHQFGAKGDPFDPMIHEALMHTTSDEVEEETCVEILQPGYRLGERVLRPARVSVAQPA